MTVISISLVLRIVAVLLLIPLVVFLQRSLKIFTRGTISFMAVAILIAAGVALVEKGNSIRNSKDRSVRLAQRQAALGGLDRWCEQTFNQHQRITSGNTFYKGDFAAESKALSMSVAQFLDASLPSNDAVEVDDPSTPLRTEAASIWLSGYGRETWAPFATKQTSWDFTIIVGVTIGDRRASPNIKIHGTIDTSAMTDSGEGWFVRGISGRIDEIPPTDAARYFEKGEFQSSNYSIAKNWSSNNRFGRRRLQYHWTR